MKKLGLALSLFLGLTMAANASIFKNFKTQGTVETKGYYVNNAFDLDSMTDDSTRKALTRVTVGTSFDLTEDVKANVTFVWGANSWNGIGSGYWGTPAMGTVGTNTNGFWGNGGLLSSIEIPEVNVEIANFLMFNNIKIGRQYIGEKGDLVMFFGQKDTDDYWHDSLHAVLADYTSDLFNVEHDGELFYGRAWEFGYDSVMFGP
ncbi:MAG TPA: hypothetical protein VMW66_02430, partial [Elusimicrobiales bacterium]|nr:hypothetical protein [Elusimicrobiales bacterium]